MKKIAIFTGAGISKESGIDTFRDAKDGYWYNYKPEDVATIEGWRKDKEQVLAFHNKLRALLPTVDPNAAHKALVELEQKYEVTVITQNVDDLHDRAGSKTIYHLHGELTKVRGSMYDHKSSQFDKVYDIGYKDINIGDKCEETGSQLRPHIVWFGEMPFNVEEAYGAIHRADVLLIIGTSLQITYTLDLLRCVKEKCRVIYIDPNPMHYLDNYGMTVEYVRKGAVEGVTEVVKKLLEEVETV